MNDKHSFLCHGSLQPCAMPVAQILYLFVHLLSCLYNLYIVYYLLLKVIIQCNQYKKLCHSKIKLKWFTWSQREKYIWMKNKQANRAWKWKIQKKKKITKVEYCNFRISPTLWLVSVIIILILLQDISRCWNLILNMQSGLQKKDMKNV